MSKDKVSKGGKTVRILLILALGILVVFALPDIIITIRNVLFSFVSKFVKIENTIPIQNDTYIQIILSIIDCGFTTLLAFAAYRLSRQLGKTEMNTHSAQHMINASRLSRMLKSNFCTIGQSFQVFCLLGNLETDSSGLYSQYIFTLYSDGLIEEGDKELLDECIALFDNLKKQHKVNEDLARNMLKATLYKYINVLEPNLQLSGPVQALIDKLDAITSKKKGD